MTRACRAFVSTCLLLAQASACRSVDVCGGQRCSVPPLQTSGAGGQPATPPEGGSAEGGATAGSPGWQAGEGGESGSAGKGESGSAGEGGESTTSGSACEGDSAECDGSRLTVCETRVDWNVRHCGGCGSWCDGLCSAGSCQETTLLQRVRPVQMVAVGAQGAFAHVLDPNSQDPDGDYALLKLDPSTAAAELVLSVLTDSAMLAASSDRVYVLDHQTLRSARLDGSNLLTEAVSSPESIGATSRGVYYLTQAELVADQYQLFYRAVGATTWQLLETYGSRSTILSSAPSGMVVATYADEDAEHCNAALSIWDGAEVVEVEGTHPLCREAKVVSDGSLVLLEYDDSTASSALSWRAPDGAVRRYAIPTPPDLSANNLITLADNVVLRFQDKGWAHVQEFSRQGPIAGRRGILAESNLVWVDRNYIWYGVWDGFISPRFLRSKWFEL